MTVSGAVYLSVCTGIIPENGSGQYRTALHTDENSQAGLLI